MDYIPAAYRKVVYTVLGIAGALVGALSVGFVAAGASVPVVLVGIAAALGYLSPVSNLLARKNVESESVEDGR